MIATQVSIPEYKVNEKLYDGSRTVVYRGYREVDGKPVVIKLQKILILALVNWYSFAINILLPNILACQELFKHIAWKLTKIAML